VPKGAFKLTPTNEIRSDETFYGLTIQTGNLLENYQHFREPVELKNREKIGIINIFKIKMIFVF
jgi:uncharacterized protein YktA (UPF0223 family)